MAKLPPLPVGVPPGHSYWNDWYERLRTLINGTFLDHNSLQNLQGGSVTERYHLTNTQSSTIINATGTTWTPTLTNSVNITASTAYLSNYIRYGSIVSCAGRIDIDPTAAGDVQLGISLPVSSALANEYELNGGAFCRTANENAEVFADAANDRATLRFTAVSTTNNTWRFWFMYRII